MVMRVTKDNIYNVKNPLLKADAERYIKIYDYFLKEIENSGIKISSENYDSKRSELLEKLKNNGALVKNNGNSIRFGALSPSCEDCRKGVGSSTYILSLACNRDCFFCANINQIDYDEGVNKINDVNKGFERDMAFYKTMTSAALTGGEPLLFPDKCVEFVKNVKNKSINTQVRIYTNGDLATPQILKNLQKAGLDEIRFGIKPKEDGGVDEAILNTIGEAVKYIPRVMVEMPITPGSLEKMKDLMLKLDALNIFGVNILEFLYPWANSDEYSARKYEIKPRPYGILHGYSYAGGLPVAGSDIDCLKLMLFCLEKGIKMGFHYCSLENKLSAQIYGLNSGIKLTETEFFSENDFFIKTAKGYGKDTDVIKKILDEAGCGHYIYNKSEGFIEFSPIYIKYLEGMNMELGLSYRSVDVDDEERAVIRELQIDVLNPKEFQLESI